MSNCEVVLATQMFAVCDVAVVGAGAKNKK